MKISIFSRKEIQKLMDSDDFPENTAVISYYNSKMRQLNREYCPVNYSGFCDNVLYCEVDDLDYDYLKEKNFTYDTFFPESADVAKFVYDAYNNGMDIICQCDYGQSRSAATAAAIAEHFYKNGIWIFADYKRCPNQVIFHKVFDALENYKNTSF